ncbi:MAG: hypothetical protein HXY23_11000 [Parvularculaceae bacterium]|nr:hypothetical protein [Parvularculaceae bacterium]
MNLRWTAAAAALALAAPATATAQDTFGGQPGAQTQQPPQQQPPPAGWPQQPQQNYPQAQPQPQSQPGGWGQPAPQGHGGWGQPAPQPQGQGGAPGGNLDQMMQIERQDYGVPPTSSLHGGQMHGPTPASIPGGQVITTKGLVALVQGKDVPYFLFDVLGGPEVLPGAIPAAWLSQPGTFQDQTQQQMVERFRQGTQGRNDVPMIFYCLSTQCWMSYNAALRAINAGYKNVLWYRGGIEAWKAAGLPVQPAQQGYGPAPQPGYSQQGYPSGRQQPAPRQQGGWPQQ